MGNIVDPSQVLLEMGLSSSPTDEQKAIVQSSIVKAEGEIKRFLHYDPVYGTRTQYYPVMDFTQQSSSYVWEVSNTDAFIRRLSESSVDELQLQHLPVRSVTNLYIDYDGRFGTRSGSFASDTEKTQGVDFNPRFDSVDSSGNSICSDGILESQGRWPSEPGSVKVIYVSGYTAAEFEGQDTVISAVPIWDAVIDETVRRMVKSYSRRQLSRLGITSGGFIKERLGDYAYELDHQLVRDFTGTGYDLMPSTVDKLQNFVNWGWPVAS